jgi:hypothetical protein
MAENWMESYQKGASGQLDLISKAADLEKNAYELEQKKQEHEVTRFKSFAQDVDNIIASPKGKLRDLAIKRAQMNSKIRRDGASPETFELMAQDEYHIPIQEHLSKVLGLQASPEQIKAIQETAAMSADPIATSKGLMQIMMERQMNAEKLASANAVRPDETVKLTNEVITNLKSTSGEEMAAISAVNKINSLGANPDLRNNPVARETVKVLLAKMQDPTTGVKEGELDRVSSIGAGYVTRVNQYMNKFLSGEGKLNEKQWKEILVVANAMGKKNQQLIGEKLSLRKDQLNAVKIDIPMVQNAVANFSMFDFKNQFGEEPAGLQNFVFKLNETKDKKQQALEELKNRPEFKGKSDEEIKAALAARQKAPVPAPAAKTQVQSKTQAPKASAVINNAPKKPESKGKR